MSLPLEATAALMSSISRSLNLAEGLVEKKSLQLEPLGIIAILSPDGEWTLYNKHHCPVVPNAIIHWKSETAAHWIRGAIIGWWPFSLQDAVAVEGDIHWVLTLQQRAQHLPFWLQHQHPIGTMLSRSLLGTTHRTLFNLARSVLQDARDTLLEDRHAVSHSHANQWINEVIKLYEATERLDARCQLLEKQVEHTALRHS
jgi:hypothetical protein